MLHCFCLHWVIEACMSACTKYKGSPQIVSACFTLTWKKWANQIHTSQVNVYVLNMYKLETNPTNHLEHSLTIFVLNVSEHLLLHLVPSKSTKSIKNGCSRTLLASSWKHFWTKYFWVEQNHEHMFSIWSLPFKDAAHSKWRELIGNKQSCFWLFCASSHQLDQVISFFHWTP